MRTVRHMPNQLLALFLLFLAMPWISILFLGSPWALFQSYRPPVAIVTFLTYWVLPLAICFGFAYRRFATLPLLLIECLLLVWHTVLNPEELSTELQIIRLLVLGVMAALGFVAINKDVIYPLMTPTLRYWRKFSRFPAHQSMHMKIEGQTELLPLVMQDASISGIGATAVHLTSQQALRALDPNKTFKVQFETGHTRYEVTAQIVWIREKNNTTYVGLSIAEHEPMSALLKTLDTALPGVGKAYDGMIDQLWENLAFRRLTIILWSMSIVASFSIPACSKVQTPPLAAKKPPVQEFQEEQIQD